jgi:hypothetical protein
MLKAVLRRVRGFMLAEVVTELAALRAEILALRGEIARRDELAREELAPVLRQTEEALLTIALNSREEGKSLSGP